MHYVVMSYTIYKKMLVTRRNRMRVVDLNVSLENPPSRTSCAIIQAFGTSSAIWWYSFWRSRTSQTKHDHHINLSTSKCPKVPTPNENKQNKQIARQKQIPILRVWSWDKAWLFLTNLNLALFFPRGLGFLIPPTSLNFKKGGECNKHSTILAYSFIFRP